MKNILVIEDNETVLNMLADWLRFYSKEWHVISATNGKLGVELMGSVPVDLVLTDLDMPVMDGYEVLKHAGEHFPSVPFLVMTGHCDQTRMAKLRSVGITDIVSKPFDFTKLAHRIKDHFEKGSPVHCPS